MSHHNTWSINNPQPVTPSRLKKKSFKVQTESDQFMRPPGIVVRDFVGIGERSRLSCCLPSRVLRLASVLGFFRAICTVLFYSRCDLFFHRFYRLLSAEDLREPYQPCIPLSTNQYHNRFLFLRCDLGFLLLCPTWVWSSQVVFKVLVMLLVSSFITSDAGILRVFFDFGLIF